MSEPNSTVDSPPTNDKQDTNQKDKPKLKILTFHGYRQNGEVFRGKLGSFRKTLSKYAQLVFFSAPHKVVNEEDGDEGNLFIKLNL